MAAYREPVVEIVCNDKANLGEGPVYDERRNELVWVDHQKRTINFLNPFSENKKKETITVDNYVGAAIPCTSGKRLIVSIGKDLSFVDRETGAVTDITSIESDRPDNRINDCKCDRKGRFWFGTIALKEGAGLQFKEGSLYSFDGVECKKFVSEVSLSNGIAFSLDWTKMYYIDSIPRTISRFDYNEETGDISNQEVIIDFNEDTTIARGMPDGMTIDAEGKIWVAEFKTGCVCRWDPETGKMLQRVSLPAPNITSCCFGGPDYSVLYVTSASSFTSIEDLEKFPNCGCVFAVTNLGIKGMPPQYFDDSKLN